MKKTSPEQRLVAARTRKIALVNDRLDGAHMDRAWFVRTLAKSIGASADVLERRVVAEWSLAVESLQVPDARGLGRRIHDALCHDMQNLGDLWT